MYWVKPVHVRIDLFLIEFHIQRVRVYGVRIKLFDDVILAVPPAMKIDFAAAITAEWLKRRGICRLDFEWLSADRTRHLLSHKEHLLVV